MRLLLRAVLVTTFLSLVAGAPHARTVRHESDRFTIAVPDRGWSADAVSGCVPGAVLGCHVAWAIGRIVVRSTAEPSENHHDIRRLAGSFAFIGPLGSPIVPVLASIPPVELDGAGQKRREWMAMSGLFVAVMVVFLGYHIWRAWKRHRQRRREKRAWEE